MHTLPRQARPRSFAPMPPHAFAKRTLMAIAALTAFTVAGAGAATAQAQEILPLRINEVIVEDGQLLALGSLGDASFETPLDISLVELIDDPQSGVCAILDLELGAIHLDLLGLQVDTSDICLRVQAVPGDNNLLGNLLCAVAGLLDGGLSLEEILAGLPLGDVLDGLTETEVEQLLAEIADLLNAALQQATDPSSVEDVSAADRVGVSGTKPNHGQGQGRGQGQGKGQGNSQGFNKQCDILKFVPRANRSHSARFERPPR